MLGKPFVLSFRWFDAMFRRFGARTFFGVDVDESGNVLRDNIHPRYLALFLARS